jgi:hypothetical protein
MDVELPDEWMAEPELFLRKDYDAKAAMIRELRRPITVEMVLQEINRYADSRIPLRRQLGRGGDRGRGARHARMEEAKRRYLARAGDGVTQGLLLEPRAAGLALGRWAGSCRASSGQSGPRGVRPLLLLALAATLILVILSSLAFLLLYRWQGEPVGALFAAEFAAGLAYFLRLGLLSALVWAPVMVLSVAGLPKQWKHETW